MWLSSCLYIVYILIKSGYPKAVETHYIRVYNPAVYQIINVIFFNIFFFFNMRKCK